MSKLNLAARVRATRAPKVPAGWLTLEQLAKVDGRANARGSFYYIARDAVDAGILEKGLFPVSMRNGVRDVAHYRLKK